MEKICVAVRVRPPSCEEFENELRWKVENNSISLHGVHNSPIPGMSFAFDHVFDKDIDNATIYELLVKNIIHAAVEGFNGTIVAYGQTGSGKTFTMKGMIPMAVEDLFRNIRQTEVVFEFQIRVSCMQIYNEDIIDLLAEDNNQNLETDHSFLRGPYVVGLTEEIVNSVNQVLGLFQEAIRRSVDLAHTLFVMVIERNPKYTYSISGSTSNADVRISVLNLVDLAGSERAPETHVGENREHIDKSLMVLGDVINKLRDHIPYCDSKLTHILRRALGGNAKTSIICTIAPEQAHIEETKRTLQFASRAKKITNCVKVNKIGQGEKRLEKVFKKHEESEENANQIEEEDVESNEENDEEIDEGIDEERDEEHDEEDEEHESNGEDYEDVGASDAEDYHPDEIYFERYDDDLMPWEHYMNSVLLTPEDGLYLKAGAIFREASLRLTSSPAFPAVNLEEVDNLFMVFESGVHHDLQLRGQTYTMIKVGPDTMHGEKGGECVTIMKTRHTLIFGVYEKPMIRAQCDALVRATANIISSQGG